MLHGHVFLMIIIATCNKASHKTMQSKTDKIAMEAGILYAALSIYNVSGFHYH